MLYHDKTVVYQPPDHPLCGTGKRYWIPELEVHEDDPEALTLVFLHATSFHKETWEPCLERILQHAIQPGSPVKIREAWALDCPNHGEAGWLNEEKLHMPGLRNNFTCEKYAQGAHRFLSAGSEAGAKVDFRKRNLVGIGHSLGGNAMLILQHLEPIIPFKFLILAEPLISPAGPQYLQKLRTKLVKGAYERRDVWPDRDTALKALKKRDRTLFWDDRIIELFVQFALMQHPGGLNPATPYHGVALACTRDQEAAMYRDNDGPTLPVKHLNLACKEKPIHLILAGKNDFLSTRVHAAIVDPSSGRKYASIKKIEGVGHLIPQEAPDRLGDILYQVLESSYNYPLKSRL